jgi:hypothetical protein
MIRFHSVVAAVSCILGGLIVLGSCSSSTSNSVTGAPPGLPAWIPVYPGVQIQNFAGGIDSGSFSFNSPDSVPKVASWYEDKAKALGMTFPPNPVAGGTGNIMAQDSKRSLNIYLLENDQNGRHTTVSVAYAPR